MAAKYMYDKNKHKHQKYESKYRDNGAIRNKLTQLELVADCSTVLFFKPLLEMEVDLHSFTCL